MKPALFLTGIAMLLPISQAMAASLAWGVGMRNGTLVVVVDATASPPNMVVDSASFNATFKDAKGQTLGEWNVALPANQIVAGNRKTWNFNQPFPSAVKVTTDSLFASWHATGEKSDGAEVAASQAMDPLPAAGVVVPAPASLADRCALYGRQAVQQNARNQALACGYSGSRWDSRPKFHSDWCATQTEAESRKEAVTRDKLLRQCARTKAMAVVSPGK